MTTRLAVFALVISCGASVRKFPTREPMTVDPDSTPFLPMPKEYKAPEIWDTVDNTFFMPLVETLAVHQTPPAKNVNALDEVPNSSWFENRIDQVAGNTEAFLRGACSEDTPDPAGPWTIVAGKPDGKNPGFQVKHANGKRYFFKPDASTSERQSIADLIGTRVHHAAGFHTACTRIIYVDEKTFTISEKAKAENFVGDKVPFTPEMLAKALSNARRNAKGEIRAGLSEFLPGKPLGPWRDFGVRPDDPNDVIPHEDRRELRGSYVFGAWLSHYDAREQNSMDMWSSPGDGQPGFVKHYQLDFGDCLGSLSEWDRVSRRRGHAYEVDWPVAFVELLTLGLLPRPWRDPQLSPAPKLGYFTVEDFRPDNYRTAYPFGPYKRVQEADAAWAARILARITPEMVVALVHDAGLTDPVMERELIRALIGRREKLLKRYLTRLSPLARPRLDGDRLCVTDARVEGGLVVEGVVKARQGSRALEVKRSGAELCVGPLAREPYALVTIKVDDTDDLRVHLYDDGGFKIAGLDRE